jgi:hypothetical protein
MGEQGSNKGVGNEEEQGGNKHIGDEEEQGGEKPGDEQQQQQQVRFPRGRGKPPKIRGKVQGGRGRGQGKVVAPNSKLRFLGLYPFSGGVIT